MKIGDIKNIKIARKYSVALFQMAQENDITDKVYNDLVFVSETINTNSDLENFLYSPIVKISDKKDVLNKVFNLHIEKTTLEFLYLLADNTRLNAINEILNQYSITFNEFNNVVKPTIISAIELEEEKRNKIKEKLENKLNKQVIPEYVINPEIIGGLVIELGDKTIDCSIKTKFDNMKKQLTKGNRYGND